MVWPVVVHSMRTAGAAVASLLVARMFRLPEAYWAPLTTLVITQSSLGAALTVSWQRFSWHCPGGRRCRSGRQFFQPDPAGFRCQHLHPGRAVCPHVVGSKRVSIRRRDADGLYCSSLGRIRPGRSLCIDSPRSPSASRWRCSWRWRGRSVNRHHRQKRSLSSSVACEGCHGQARRGRVVGGCSGGRRRSAHVTACRAIRPRARASSSRAHTASCRRPPWCRAARLSRRLAPSGFGSRGRARSPA